MASYSRELTQYMNEIMRKVTLPKSVVEQYDKNSRGLYVIPSERAIGAKEEHVGPSGVYSHEKSAPGRYLIKNLLKSNAYSPTYIKPFSGISNLEKLSTIIANSTLRLYPTPLQAYGVVHQQGSLNEIGVATIDLNHLKNLETQQHVESARLDKVLASQGLPVEINCFMDFQKLLENESVAKTFTPRALVQLGLSSIFIPNAVRETDVNSRNIVALKSANGEQYDTIVRLDADKNLYVGELYEREICLPYVVPKGIYGPNESMDDYLKNISGAGLGQESSACRVDWDLFRGFVNIARFATDRSHIDGAVMESYSVHRAADSGFNPFSRSSYDTSFNADAFFDFSGATIESSQKFLSDVSKALNQRQRDFSDKVLDALETRRLTEELPFAEASSKYPGIVVKEEGTALLAQEEQSLEQ